MIAHQGGWDEILLVLGPIAVIVGLLMLARKRVDAAEQKKVAAKGAQAAGSEACQGLDALDVGADADEATDEIVVATVDVVHAADDRLALGREPGHHQRGAGADVGSTHRRAAQSLDATHHGVVAVGADVGAESLQLLDVSEAAGIEVLGDDARRRRRQPTS